MSTIAIASPEDRKSSSRTKLSFAEVVEQYVDAFLEEPTWNAAAPKCTSPMPASSRRADIRAHARMKANKWPRKHRGCKASGQHLRRMRKASF